LRSFEQNLPEFERRGIQVVGISTDPPETTREWLEKAGFTFPILSDAKTEVLRRYDLLHAGGGQGADVARPAEILIDPSGTVRWLDLTEDYRVRARPETVLAEFDRLAK
jgi:peroxiredoxin